MLADGVISIATKSKIESSTIDSVRGEGAKAVQKRRLQIFITRGPKFEEHRAEVRRLVYPLQRPVIVGCFHSSVAAKAEGEAAKK